MLRCIEITRQAAFKTREESSFFAKKVFTIHFCIAIQLLQNIIAVTNKFGGKSYLGLGVVSLLLNDYIDVDGEYPKGITDKVFALPLNNNGTEVHITLNSLLFGEMDSPGKFSSHSSMITYESIILDIDDTMSVHSSISAQSDSSFMGASFYDGPGNASYYPGRSATHDTIHENPEGEDEDADPSKLNESANDATLTEAKIRELASRNSEKVWAHMTNYIYSFYEIRRRSGALLRLKRRP